MLLMPETENLATGVKEKKKPGPKPKPKVESIDSAETKINPAIQDNVEGNFSATLEIGEYPSISEPIQSEDKLEPLEQPIYDRQFEPNRSKTISTCGKTVLVYRNKNFNGAAIRYKGVLKVMNEVEGGYKVNYMNSGFGYCIGYVKTSVIKSS